MIYIVSAIQLLTVAVALVIVRWSINYLTRQDELMTKNVDAMMATVSSIVAEHNREVYGMVDQAYKEREQLLNRITSPEVAATQLPDMPDPKLSVLDEQGEWDQEHPEGEGAGDDADEPHPTVLGLGVKKPIGPVQPIQGGKTNA